MAEPVRILCVDDERNVLRSLERLFLDDGYEIRTALSGAEGLLALGQGDTVQVVISDYRMPGMNGVEFLSEVRKSWPETVRIILSGYADTGAIVSAINDGQIYKFIAKPWNEDEIRVAVTNAVERYNLGRENRTLAAELRAKNDELTALNRDLEARVEERTAALTTQNRLLTESLNILDNLPFAVVGMSLDGTVFQCNRKGMVCFGNRIGPVIGADRREVLTAAQNRLVDRVIDESRRSHDGNASGEEGNHRVVIERSPYTSECVILIVNEEAVRG
ncbi:MAG: response regulator [Deltaproteobacteria bacterium]|nr:response regulator [Deltaproteobacteria bacterium]